MMANAPRLYANTACPYCSGALNPPPKAKKRCPACGQPIYVLYDRIGYMRRELVFMEKWL